MAWGPFNAGGGGGSSGGTAADISYDNSKSGISAANVQEAIDALSVLTLTIQAVPAQSGSLTYTGSTQSPTWKGYDSSMMTIGGVTSGTVSYTHLRAHETIRPRLRPSASMSGRTARRKPRVCRGRLAEPRSRMCRHRPAA